MKTVKYYARTKVAIPDLILKIRNIAGLRQGRKIPRADRLSRTEMEQLVLWMQKQIERPRQDVPSIGGVNENQ